MFIHFLNGNFVTDDNLLISPKDLGYVRGYAVADFIVTYDNEPFKLSEHIDRLFKSAEIISLQLPWSKQQVIGWAIQTLNKNDKSTEKTIKIVISGGVSHNLLQAEIPTIVMIVDHRKRKPPSSYEYGIKVKAVEYRRQYPNAKHTNYVEAIRQLANIEAKEIEDIIFYDSTQVYEGSGTNIFAVINNKLVTTKSNIVEGITRNTLLEILRISTPIEIKDFTFDELNQASEVFLTGSNSEVRGVIEINGKLVGDGKVGNITKEVYYQYQEYIRNTI